MQLTFRLDLRSDYHIGAGHGLGSRVDAALFRDGDGVPAIRGTVLAGLLREALCSILQVPALSAQRRCKASGLANSWPTYCEPTSPCPVCNILGSPGVPKHWEISSGRPAGVTLPSSVRWKAGRTGSQVVQRVRVSPRTRRAEPQKLFSQEEGDARLQFVFTVTRSESAPSELDEAAMLVAASRLIRRIGLGRRRGRGECRIGLVAAEAVPTDHATEPVQQYFLDRFEHRWLKNTTQASSEAAAVRAWSHASSSVPPGGPVRLRLIVRTDEPVVVARRADAGNKFESLTFIPGSAVLGAFAERAAREWDLGGAQSGSELYQRFVRVFRRDGVHFTPLYCCELVGNEIYPAMPAPLDLLTCKLHPGFHHDDSDPHGTWGAAGDTDVPTKCFHCSGSEVPLIPLGDFVSLRQRCRSVSPRLREEMHIRMDPATGRAEGGALFDYTALEIGQYFVGEISCADEDTWAAFCKLSDIPGGKGAFQLRVGKATRRGYGAVTTWIEPLPADAPPFGTGLPIEQRVEDPDRWLVMTLLTDAILVDPWGRHHQTFDVRWIEDELLQMSFTLEREEGGLPLLRAFCAAGFIDAFNAHLGLPRWRDIALRAGSAVGMRLKGPVSLDALQQRLRQIEADGIGLRRGEGFGRVAFNHPAYTGCASVSDSAIRLPQPLRLASSSQLNAAQGDQHSQDAWDEELRRDFRPELFGHEQWLSVARWIRESANRGVAAIEGELATIGAAGIPGAGMPAGRDKKRFLEADGKAGCEHLKKLLASAAAGASSPHSLRLRLETFADRIGAAAQSRAHREEG